MKQVIVMNDLNELHQPRPYSAYHEDYGAVLWHVMPISEPPYCGSPLDSDWPHEGTEDLWWTPLPEAGVIHANWEKLTAK